MDIQNYKLPVAKYRKVTDRRSLAETLSRILVFILVTWGDTRDISIANDCSSILRKFLYDDLSVVTRSGTSALCAPCIFLKQPPLGLHDKTCKIL